MVRVGHTPIVQVMMPLPQLRQVCCILLVTEVAHQLGLGLVSLI